MHPLRKLISDKKLLGSIAQEYGTPVYIYSQQRIEENVSNLKMHFRLTLINFIFAMQSSQIVTRLIKAMRNSFSKIGGIVLVLEKSMLLNFLGLNLLNVSILEITNQRLT